jgi:hypothetical protein
VAVGREQIKREGGLRGSTPRRDLDFENQTFLQNSPRVP